MTETLNSMLMIVGLLAGLIGVASSLGAPFIFLRVLQNELKWLRESMEDLKAAVWSPDGLKSAIQRHEVQLARLEEFRKSHVHEEDR